MTGEDAFDVRHPVSDGLTVTGQIVSTASRDHPTADGPRRDGRRSDTRGRRPARGPQDMTQPEPTRAVTAAATRLQPRDAEPGIEMAVHHPGTPISGIDHHPAAHVDADVPGADDEITRPCLAP